ncbi:MAG: hypothetical protein WD046_11735 [Paracoccaceae bacterium]
MRLMISALFLWLLPILAVAQGRAVVVVCLANNAAPITLDLWRQSVFGVELHCIDARFINGLTPCAPDSGYGLSEVNTGQLMATTDSDAQAFGNVGGITYVRIAPLTIEFWGGQSTGDGDAPVRDWTYTVDRVSGVALLQREGTRTVYSCGVVR